MSSSSVITGPVHTSDFDSCSLALTKISDASTFTWNPRSDWPRDDYGCRMTIEEVAHRLQDVKCLWEFMKMMGKVMKKPVYGSKARTYAQEIQRLETFKEKQQYMLAIQLGNHSWEWAAHTEAALDN